MIPSAHTTPARRETRVLRTTTVKSAPGMVARTAATPVGTRLLEPGDLRRTISVVHRTDDRPAPAAEAFRALLRGAFGRAAQQRQEQ